MQAPQINWSDWSFGPGKHPVQGAAHAGIAALWVTTLGDLTGLVPAGWPLVAGGLLAMAAMMTAVWQDMTGPAIVYRAVCCLAAGVWSSATLAFSTPLSRWPLVTLATGVGLAAVVGSGLARAERRETARRAGKPAPAPEPETPRDPLVAEWQARIARVTRRDVTVSRAEPWDPPTGFTLHVILPADGTTVTDLKAFEAQLASAANLPVGCNVEVLPSGKARRLVRIRVATENAMAQTRYLADAEARTIAERLPIGDHADGSAASIHLRFTCCVLVGQTDSGKSNTLNVITHRVAQCTDAVVWAIDVSGQGRFPAPWVRAWAEGRAPLPVIDWAAATEDEARLLVAAAINVINGRSAAYRQLMFEANEDKIPVSPQLPQIIILVDEFADLPRDIKDALETISNTGRGAAVRVVSCVLRAIGQDISRAMIVQARERIAMRMSDEGEAQYLFDSTWGRGRFDPNSMPYQGSGLLMTDGGAPLPFRARRLDPKRIDTASVELARLRTRLDDVSAQLADTITQQVQTRTGWEPQEITGVYGRRWERMLPVMFPTSGGGQGRATAAAQPAGEPASGTTTTATATRQDEVTAVDLGESARSLEDVAERARRAVEQAEAEAAAEKAQAGGEADTEPDPPIEADFSVVESWLPPITPPERLDWRMRIRQIVQEHRRDGVGPRAVWQQLRDEGYGTAEQTVISRMRADAEAGVLAQPGGKGSPYLPGPRWTDR